MISGQFVEELPWDELSNRPFDDYSFIWKNFSSLKYHTLYAEDAPAISIFNFEKEGFYKPPTDYYLRPLNLAMEEHRDIWSNNHDCARERLETDVVLDWVKEFMRVYKEQNFFAFTFITRLTHDNINKVGQADIPYLKFFQDLKKDGILDNTMVIFFSDHGIRFGEIRESYIGKLEERLPFVHISMPPWFLRQYPEAAKSLEINQERLTTFFDLYATLSDVLSITRQGTLSFDNKPNPSRIHSLFTEIPDSRTCKDAAILPHWCTCHMQVTIDVNQPYIQRAAHVVVTAINKQLIVYGNKCAILTLNQVKSALTTEPNDEILKFRKSKNDVIGRKIIYGERDDYLHDVLLTLETRPGGAVFEATIREVMNEWIVLGDISRINRYGHQSDCITVASHKKYCFCT